MRLLASFLSLNTDMAAEPSPSIYLENRDFVQMRLPGGRDSDFPDSRTRKVNRSGSLVINMRAPRAANYLENRDFVHPPGTFGRDSDFPGSRISEVNRTGSLINNILPSPPDSVWRRAGKRLHRTRVAAVRRLSTPVRAGAVPNKTARAGGGGKAPQTGVTVRKKSLNLSS